MSFYRTSKFDLILTSDIVQKMENAMSISLINRNSNILSQIWSKETQSFIKH